MTVSARRCSQCATNWPDTWNGYEKCPRCEVKTDRITNATALSKEEAERLEAGIEFEREYEKYDQGESSKCGPGRKGPSPDEPEEARLWAAEQVRILRELKELWRLS